MMLISHLASTSGDGGKEEGGGVEREREGHTHTHTHTQVDRPRGRQTNENLYAILSKMDLHTSASRKQISLRSED